MAGPDLPPPEEAKWWFKWMMIGLALYVGSVFAFIL